MANKNYNKMLNNKNNEKESKLEKTSIIEEVFKPEEPEIVEEVSKLEKPVEGFVSGCKRLNVRKKPSINSDVVCVIDDGTEVLVIKSDSTNEWFEVIAANGEKGYCMKKYITTN